MGVTLDAIKKAVELATTMNNAPLVSAIAEVQQSLLELQGRCQELLEEKAQKEERIRQLEARVHELEAQAERAANVDFRDGVYVDVQRPNETYCPKCFDADSKLVHLGVCPDGYTPYCPACRAPVTTSRSRARRAEADRRLSGAGDEFD